MAGLQGGIFLLNSTSADAVPKISAFPARIQSIRRKFYQRAGLSATAHICQLKCIVAPCADCPKSERIGRERSLRSNRWREIRALAVPGPAGRKRYFPNRKRLNVAPQRTSPCFGGFAAASHRRVRKYKESVAFRDRKQRPKTGSPLATALTQRPHEPKSTRGKDPKNRSAADRNFSIPANRPGPVSST
jgi:hypothetical protein